MGTVISSCQRTTKTGQAINKSTAPYEHLMTSGNELPRCIRPIQDHSKTASAGCGQTVSEHNSPRIYSGDVKALLGVREKCGDWKPEGDAKLTELYELIVDKHPHRKIIVFTQFADTVSYLTEQLLGRGVSRMAAVTGNSENPTKIAWRFSPVSNEKRDPDSRERGTQRSGCDGCVKRRAEFARCGDYCQL